MGGAGSGLVNRYAELSRRRTNGLRSRYGVMNNRLRSRRDGWGGSGPAKRRYYGVRGGWDGRSLFLETDAAPVRRSKGPSPSGGGGAGQGEGTNTVAIKIPRGN